ncbi:MAG: hypothetical protein KDA61_04590 [Planctomycetales bacterium]|nr:hypothetical protein [Planctomycetales bacterium]
MSKKRFLCLQRSQPASRSQCEAPTPEQMQQMQSCFQQWMEKYRDHLVDLGGRLTGASKVVTSNGATDGPFAETVEVLGGYMIIEADDVAKAVEIAQQSPGVMGPGSSVEVREIATS